MKDMGQKNPKLSPFCKEATKAQMYNPSLLRKLKQKEGLNTKLLPEGSDARGCRNLSSKSTLEHSTEKNFLFSNWNNFTRLIRNFWLFKIAIFGEFTIHWKDSLRPTDRFTIAFSSNSTKMVYIEGLLLQLCDETKWS